MIEMIVGLIGMILFVLLGVSRTGLKNCKHDLYRAQVELSKAKRVNKDMKHKLNAIIRAVWG